jgi:two-component system response regulator
MDSPKTRILIVEDNADDQALLMRQLKKAELDQHVKVIGEDALDYLTTSAAASGELVAIFLDLNIPSLGGLELLERIRADDKIKNLPVIVMTSSNAAADLRECQRLGVSFYVQKPVTYATFTKAVAESFHTPSSRTDALPELRQIE